VRDAECVELLRWALPRVGLRWEGFRRVRRQVCRRIERRIAELKLGSATEYRSLLASDPGEWRTLDGLCRVTISRFFRDRVLWSRLGDEVMPEVARAATRRGERTLRCWSAGCASGEEPYGLAIVFRLAVAPAFPGLELGVVATDADEVLLERARRACYAPGTVREVPPEWRERAFERRGPELCLRAAFREGVELRREDLRRAMPDGPFHLVLCRNVAFTYFDADGQRAVLAGIAARLALDGVLVVGAHEALPEPTAGLERSGGALPIFRRARPVQAVRDRA
jgi:chemotaxis protein methyltransferase CheR